MNPDRFDEIDADLNHFELYRELHPEFNNNNNQFYDIENFNGTFDVNGSVVNDLSVIHVNVRLLNANVNDLNMLLSLLIMQFDIVCHGYQIA